MLQSLRQTPIIHMNLIKRDPWEDGDFSSLYIRSQGRSPLLRGAQAATGARVRICRSPHSQTQGILTPRPIEAVPHPHSLTPGWFPHFPDSHTQGPPCSGKPRRRGRRRGPRMRSRDRIPPCAPGTGARGTAGLGGGSVRRKGGCHQHHQFILIIITTPSWFTRAVPGLGASL
jgi:hypothetical protein